MKMQRHWRPTWAVAFWIFSLQLASVKAEKQDSLRSIGRSAGFDGSGDVEKKAAGNAAAKLSPPYLDEFGNICQDKMEMMQHVEYDKQIVCKVKMKKHCEEQRERTGDGMANDIDGNTGCRIVNEKKCSTLYKPKTTKVKVRVCPNDIDLDQESKDEMKGNSVVIDVRPTPIPKFTRQAKCVDGKRAMCVTKYETECTNKEVEYEMMEDHPRCRVEMIEKCKEEEEKEADDNELSNFIDKMMMSGKRSASRRAKKCQKYPAMRCKIEKMKVMKKKPETKCSRVPRKFCRKESCNRSFDVGASSANSTNTNLHKHLQSSLDPAAARTIMDEALCYFRIQTGSMEGGIKTRMILNITATNLRMKSLMATTQTNSVKEPTFCGKGINADL